MLGSGNVYEDLDDPQAEEMFAKAQVVARVVAIIDAKGLSYARIAQLTGWKVFELESVLRGQFRDTDVAHLRQLAAALSD